MGGHEIIVCHNYDGEWAGIYVDNELFVEDHNLHEMHWINLISKYRVFSSDIKSCEVADEYLEEMVGFPNNFNDIPSKFLIEV